MLVFCLDLKRHLVKDKRCSLQPLEDIFFLQTVAEGTIVLVISEYHLVTVIRSYKSTCQHILPKCLFFIMATAPAGDKIFPCPNAIHTKYPYIWMNFCLIKILLGKANGIKPMREKSTKCIVLMQIETIG